MATWYTVEEFLTRWGVGAPPEERVTELLAVSKQQNLAYAPLPFTPGVQPVTVEGTHNSGATGTYTFTREGDVVRVTGTTVGPFSLPAIQMRVTVPEGFRSGLQITSASAPWTVFPGPPESFGLPVVQNVETTYEVVWRTTDPMPVLTLSGTPEEIFNSILYGSDSVGVSIPDGHREAHYIQARNIWNATLKAPGSTDFGPDGMPIALHPLDWHVKQLLRPRTAVPKVR